LHRVHTVVVTHSHPDHFGGAGLLAEESGDTIVVSDFFRTWWDPEDLDDRELEAAPPASTDVAPMLSGLRSPFGRPTPWGGRTEELPPERRAEIEANLSDAMRWFRVPRPS